MVANVARIGRLRNSAQRSVRSRQSRLRRPLTCCRSRCGRDIVGAIATAERIRRDTMRGKGRCCSIVGKTGFRTVLLCWVCEWADGGWVQ